MKFADIVMPNNSYLITDVITFLLLKNWKENSNVEWFCKDCEITVERRISYVTGWFNSSASKKYQ